VSDVADGCERKQDRWTPDEQLVAAVLSGTGKKMADLCDADRSWVVAALTRRGHTADDIADRLGCSLRLVRSIRALDMTQVCLLMQSNADNATNEIRLLRSELRATEIAAQTVREELARTRDKLNRLIDAQIVGAKVCGKCGTPMTGYNVYVHPATGKEYCRECHRRRQANYRARNKTHPVQIDGAEHQSVTADSVTISDSCD